MPKRLINAQIGFFAGSFLYFLFLYIAVLCEHYGVFRHYSDSQPQTWAIICTFGSSESFWYRTVSNAALSHRMQPHYLYLCALISALLFSRVNRPFRQDLPLYTHRFAGLTWTFFSVVALNLWFSGANILPRYVRW